MTQTTEQRRTIEARLDRLKKRAAQAVDPLNANSVAMCAVLKGTLDLLSDVLLEDEPR